jgi:hypothetical protein
MEARAVPLPQNTEEEETRWIQHDFCYKRGNCEVEIAFLLSQKGAGDRMELPHNATENG